MDFQPDMGLTAFREGVRQFLKKNLLPDLVQNAGGQRSTRENQIRWQKILNGQGWGAPEWSVEHGGPGWSLSQVLAFNEECVAAGAPAQDIFAQKLLGPVLNAFATPEQKAEHLPPIFNGDRLWCQGFSEPGSGSDLASLRTRADLVTGTDDNYYVVNGQKIWTTYGHQADWIFLLVRTNPEAKKQAGISFLLVDMKTPGITVRPIRSIDDCHHLNEIFFDNVRVPVKNLIGAEGGGWSITKFLLNNEHASTAELPLLQRYLRDLRQMATRERIGDHLLCDRPEFALKLARLEAEVQAIAMMVQRVAAFEQEHNPASHTLGSMLKIRGTELQQKISEFLVDSLGDYGAVTYPCVHGGADTGEALPMQEIASGVAADMFFRRATTIYGGTSEVQRGIIAKLLFQL
jgi:acyl-CoA dehydrogenase